MGRALGEQPFLVGQSAGRFHVTKAGSLIVRKPRRFPVVPGTPLAADLISAARAGRGKVHNTLEKKHAAALGNKADQVTAEHLRAAVEKMKHPRRPIFVDPSSIGLICTVCEADVGPGGRKTSPALCARCYQRERRGQAPAPRSTAEPRDQSITFQVSKKGREQLERAAKKFGVTLSTLVSRIVLGEVSVERVPR